jgi:glucose-1-phosphatase
MATPEVVVFDLGKVLLDFDYTHAAEGIAARGTITPRGVKDLINQSPLLFRYETGLMTKQEFYEAIRKETGFKGDIAEFGNIFGDIFEPMPEMIELHAALQKSGIPTFIFSNTNELAIDHIRKEYPFFNGFTGYILSYEHGAMKPQQKLYEVVESKTGLRREKIIYLDDRLENIEAGLMRNWQVILQETPEKSRAALKAAGLIG